MRIEGTVIGFLVLLGLLMAAPGGAAQSEPSIDVALAEQYFREARAISAQDNGRLWKIPLYGPMLFVDPETREVVANQADGAGQLTQRGDVFTGRLPKEENIANTATRWAGVEWTMIMWPLPDDRQERARLMMHELFHRIQSEIGLAASDPSNPQLDTAEGRIWLQLEWRALEMALWEASHSRNANGAPEGRRAIKGAPAGQPGGQLTGRCTESHRDSSGWGPRIADALIFRYYRNALFPQGAAEERALETNEGLAEYTGVKLSTRSDAEFAIVAACGLRQARYKPTFVRSFAYASGPAYGELLDESGLNWRQTIKAGDDLGLLLQKAFGIKLPQASREEAIKRARDYDGEALIAAETRRERVRQKELAKYRARLIEGPVLILPLSDQVQYQFNPNNLVSLETAGTVYPTIRVSDAWGIFEASNGALLSREKGRAARIQAPAPSDLNARPLKGDGWTLELNAGWKLMPGERKGDLTVRKVE